MAPTQKIDREAVKTLAIAIGVREAARKLGLNEDTVCSWAKRGAWFTPKPKPPSNAINVQALQAKPSTVLADALADDSKATRIGFSRAARKVATHVSEMAPEALTTPAIALSASKWHQVAEGVHQWNAEKRGNGIMPALNIYSEQTVVQVGQ